MNNRTFDNPKQHNDLDVTAADKMRATRFTLDSVMSDVQDCVPRI